MSSGHFWPFCDQVHSECLHTHLLYDVTSFFEQNLIQSECCSFSSEHIQLESRTSQYCVGLRLDVSATVVVESAGIDVVAEVVAIVVVVVVIMVVVVLVVVVVVVGHGC